MPPGCNGKKKTPKECYEEDGRAGCVQERRERASWSRGAWRKEGREGRLPGGGSQGWRSLPLWKPELLLRGAVRPRPLAVAGFRPVRRERRASSNVDKLAQ